MCLWLLGVRVVLQRYGSGLGKVGRVSSRVVWQRRRIVSFFCRAFPDAEEWLCALSARS